MSVIQTDATAAAPPEILSRILSLSLDIDCPAESLDVRKGAWPYGRVCRRWRDLVLSNPFLWDHFVAQIAQPLPEWPLPDVPEAMRHGPGGIDIAKEAQIQYKRHYDNFIKDRTTLSPSSVSILMEYLKRSGGVPLHVSLEVPESVELANRDIKDAFFALLLSHVSRWKTLQCTIIKEPVRALVGEALIREAPKLIHFQGIPPCSSSETPFCYYPFFQHFADTLVSLDITPVKISFPNSNHTITTMSHLRSLKVFSTDVLDQLKAPALDELAISSTHKIAALNTFMERSQIFDRLQSLSLMQVLTPIWVDIFKRLIVLSALIMEDIIDDLSFLRGLSGACPKLKTLKISESKQRQGPQGLQINKESLVFLIRFLNDRLETGTLENVSIQLNRLSFLDADQALTEQVEALNAKEGVEVTFKDVSVWGWGRFGW
ncbi:hypothetical protein ARMSODRAFT_206378 [Armillaria solidipes]|uniref:Uncharacterized protein n=1 Tax=Armillaria solidipes TaxID=1076256 RepID=A0A2H3BRA0_9AGAR|nr:hypothetical protein ARMSODRAFT_206378 [Armillaria solidipes]